MRITILIAMLMLIVSCGSDSGGSSSSDSSSGGAVTHVLDYSSGTNVPGDCATTIEVTEDNEIFTLELPVSSGIDFADFVESSNSASSGVANYASSTTDIDYDEGACAAANSSYSYDRTEISVFGTYSSGAVSGTFVYQDICDNSGSEVTIVLCSGNISKQ